MKLIFGLFFTLSCSAAFAETVLNCTGEYGDSFVKTLVLQKNGSSYAANMESAREDGVVNIEIKTVQTTAHVKRFILIEDHDLKMTLVTSEKNAIVLFESANDVSEPTDVEFLNCN